MEQAQVETLTVIGTITLTGDAKVTVTAVGMTNSPKDVTVAVLDTDTDTIVGGKVRVALAADLDINTFFVVSGATADVVLTARAAAENDATMNMAIDNDTCTGLTPVTTSADTTPGIAPIVAISNSAMNRSLERISEKGAEDVELVVSLNAKCRRVLMVIVKYSAAPTQAGVTVALDSGAGPAYDATLYTGIADTQTNTYLPSVPIPFLSDDAVVVTAPAGGAGITAAIAIYAEPLEG